ncbi:MAG: response regulator [Bacteriovoracia bacterium]
MTSDKPITDETQNAFLVVDDEKDLREIISDYLATKGSPCLRAESGNAAYKLIEERGRLDGNPRIRSIVADWKMPDGDGMELLREIRTGPFQSIPVLLISGAASKEQLLLAAQAGPDAILLKPFDMGLLYQKVLEAEKVRETKEFDRLMKHGR